jgi:hypothetical protein
MSEKERLRERKKEKLRERERERERFFNGLHLFDGVAERRGRKRC